MIFLRRLPAAIALSCFGLLAPLVKAQTSVALKPSIRPFTDHPFQSCRDSLYSSYQSSLGRIELTLQEMKRAGVQIARLEIPWLLIEPAVAATYEWSRTDRIMELLRRYQITPLATFLSCPLSVGSGLTPTLHPAAGPALTRFIRDFLDRYPGQVPYVEIGNEPDQIYFVENFGWGRPADKYIRDVLVPVAVALRQSHPGVKLLNAGEFRQLPSLLFSSLFIPALGRRETPLDWIDIFSVHYVQTISELQAMRSRLDAAGYGHVEIWLTECDHYDTWGVQTWGFRDLVRQAWPQLVTQFFEYTSVNGYLYKIDPASGRRYQRYDDGGILDYGFDRNQQNYLDFTAASAGPFSIDALAPRVGVAFQDMAVKGPAPGTAWSQTLAIANLGRDAHMLDVSFSGSGRPEQTLTLPAGHGVGQLHLQGTRPRSGCERLKVLARSRADGREADLTRVVLRAPRGSNLSTRAQFDPRYSALFDSNPSTDLLVSSRPEDIVLRWSGPVRIEEIEIHTAAGNLVDTASSFIECEHWDGAGWQRFAQTWAREGRDANGPAEFRIVEDGESLPELPIVVRQIRLRIWHQTRIAGIDFYGNPAPGNSAPQCRLSFVPISDPSAPWSWYLEGMIYDPDGLLGDIVGLSLEMDGANDILLPLATFHDLVGPTALFAQAYFAPTTYRFRFAGGLLMPSGRHSFVLRARDRQGRQDFDLVTVIQR